MSATFAAALGLATAATLLGCAGREIPVVLQQSDTDDCAASMVMALAYHGQTATIAELRPLVNTSREGTCTALTLVKEAKRREFKASGVLVEQATGIQRLPRASLVHWIEDAGPFPRTKTFANPLRGRFMVLDRIEGDHVKVVDPATGRRDVDMAEFLRHFSGVVVLLEEL